MYAPLSGSNCKYQNLPDLMMVHVAPKRSALILTFIVKCTTVSLLISLNNFLKKKKSIPTDYQLRLEHLQSKQAFIETAVKCLYVNHSSEKN